MKRPGNLNNWKLGEVTGDALRADRRKTKVLNKIDKRIAETEAKLKELEANKSGGGLAGWLAGWF